ncbi:MAG: hypothetical protein NVS3B20_12220 [Polyangiales bacterium]
MVKNSLTEMSRCVVAIDSAVALRAGFSIPLSPEALACAAWAAPLVGAAVWMRAAFSGKFFAVFVELFAEVLAELVAVAFMGSTKGVTHDLNGRQASFGCTAP